jgi:hypothetical protein
MKRPHHSILLSIEKFLLLMFLLGFASNNYAQDISLFLNQNSFVVGERLELAVAADSSQLSVTHADVYLAVQFPDGSLYYLSDLENIFFEERNQIAPIVSAWPVKTLAKITLFSLEIPKRLSSGIYKWYLTLVAPGANVEQPVNWIANASIELKLSGSSGNSDFAEEEAESTKPGSTVEFPSADAIIEDGREVTTTSPSSPPPPLPSVAPIMSGGEGGASSDTAGTVPTECCLGDVDDELWIPPSDKQIPIQSGTLTAGDIDDHLNFTALQRYVERQLKSNVSLPFIEVKDRITLNILDAQGQGLSHARIVVTPSGTSNAVLETYAGSDGRFYLFPHFDGIQANQLDLQVSPPEDVLGSPTTVTLKTTLDLQQLDESREFTVTLPETTTILPPSLDMMFVIDTTGSMSDELDYLTVELRDIISTVHARYPQVDMRFGLIVYRDQGDVYVVKDLGFTDSLNLMQIQLSEQRAVGGGDYPEAMEEAMLSAINAEWRMGNVARLLFLIADAPPHDENLLAMLEQVHTARQMGLRVYSLAASGVGDVAEFILRLSAVLTQGRYLFLTDDSGVGLSHAEPTVPCYVVTHLDQLISRVIVSELSGKRVEPAPTEIVRTVGGYEAGVCEISGNQQ